MSTPPPLFDPAAQLQRAARAARASGSADFLHRRAAEGVAERLGDVIRPFPAAAVIGGGGVYAASLWNSFGIETLVQMERSPAMAARAAALIPEAEIVIGDGAARLGEGRFDLIVAGGWLHGENDVVGALVQMRRALKPDGLMIAAMAGGRTLCELRAALAEAESAVEGGLSPRVAPMADIRDLGGLLQRAGFAMPVADCERLTIDYADAWSLMRDLRAMGEANALAGRRRGFTRRATLETAARLYARCFGLPGGRVAATVEIVFLTGWSPGPDQPVAKRPGSATARLADALGAVERSAGEKVGRRSS
ncbi:MAG: methyltransferase domain-containing protein [Rhodobacteraceae bacterium]|nr:MAG: methyltransferase domain-containing protein [Paracoccaceae bacterium]